MRYYFQMCVEFLLNQITCLFSNSCKLHNLVKAILWYEIWFNACSSTKIPERLKYHILFGCTQSHSVMNRLYLQCCKIFREVTSNRLYSQREPDLCKITWKTWHKFVLLNQQRKWANKQEQQSVCWIKDPQLVSLWICTI